MKKLYTLLVAAFVCCNFAFGQTCVIDSANTAIISPPADSIPCAEANVPYTTNVQLYIPDSIDLIDYGAPFNFVLYVDSVVLTGVTGLPTGISATINPDTGTFFPQQFACIELSGTTADTGRYNIFLTGTITAHGTPYPPIFDGDTTIDLATLQLMALGALDITLDVIPEGAACRSLWQGQPCIPDPANTDFFAPRPEDMPCIERTLQYDEVIQISVPASIDLQDFGAPFPFILYVDSMVISGVNGLPNGITYQANPSNGVLYGGERGCALVTGTTTAPPGHYPVTFVGSLTAHGLPFPPLFDGDTTIDFATLQSMSSSFEMYVDVIEPGNPCRITSIKGLNADLNSLINIYPNPNNGTFTFSINAGRRINGEINVLDVMGRKVFAQPLDIVGAYSTTIDLNKHAKGLYTVQLKTAEGFASKNVSIE